jgi:hypothetical protein
MIIDDLRKLLKAKNLKIVDIFPNFEEKSVNLVEFKNKIK